MTWKSQKVAAALCCAAGLLGQTRLAQPPSLRARTDERIAALSKQAAANPKAAHTQNQLAAAYIQKMRETVDFGYLERADAIIDDVLTRDAGNYEALRLRTEIAMERHEFARVAEYAQEMTKLAPADPGNWGSLGDASMELAHYDEARQAYEKMVSLRPDLASYNRLSYYHFVSGDPDGAIRLMKSAIEGGSSAPENTAWCLADLGNMYFKTGKIADAQASFEHALKVFPNYYPARAGLGRVFAATGKNEQAIENYGKAQAVVPMPEYAAALQELYLRSGKPLEARKQNELLDVIEKMAVAGNEKTNRNLALLYADHDRNLDRALELVQNEITARPDVYTNDALAWVLFKRKEYQAAAQASAKALAMHTPEPSFYYHAGMIAAAMGKRDEAKADLAKALALNPKFDAQASIAASTLRKLQ